MRPVLSPLVCGAVLFVGLQGQTPPTPVPGTPPVAPKVDLTPEQLEAARMQREYLTGDPDAAVAYFARRPPDEPASPSHGSALDLIGFGGGDAGGLVRTLLVTEVAMRRQTFGKYANSAPLETATDVVGLNGAFETQSLMLYRNLDDLLYEVRDQTPPRNRDLRARTEPRPASTARPVATDADRALVEGFAREWHVITISYCLRWQLNCARNLLASAKERFPGAADVLVVEAATAEQKRQLSLAESLLRRAVASEPGNVAAQLRLGRVLLARGRTTEGQTVLERALTAATSAHHDATKYFALESLADLDRRAGRATRARDRAAEAASIAPFKNQLFEGLTPENLYRFGLFYEQPRRLAVLREFLRTQMTR